MAVLVTGAAGYLGSMLVEKLINLKLDVIGVDSLIYHNMSSLSGFIGRDNFKFYPIDIRDSKMKELYKQCNTIYALAAIVGAPRCSQNEQLATETNQEAIIDMLNNLSGQRVIFPTTNSQYGTSEKICTESSPTFPLSLYSKTKDIAEKCVLSYDNSVSLRLATVFGSSFRPRFDLLVNNWTAEIFFMKKLKIFESHFKRNFVHIKDIIRCLVFMSDPQFQGIYNVGLDSANMTKMELAHKICDVLKVPRENVVEGEGEDKDKRDYIVSSSKLLNTGFKFNYSLEHGILEVKQLCENIGYPVFKMGNV